MFKLKRKRNWTMGLSFALASICLTLSPISQARNYSTQYQEPVEASISDNSHYDYAWVIKSKPIYEEVRVNHPKQICWDETRYRQVPQYTQTYHESSATAPILGALIGGAIGNKLGNKKSNKRIGTVAGALLGGAIAIDHNQNQRTHKSYRTEPYTERKCRTDNEVRYENRLVGYKVKYRYKGKVYKTRMAQEPGDQIKVAVNIQPLVY